MSAYRIQEETLTGIANAIRGKDGLTTQMTPSQMITRINNIPEPPEPDTFGEELLTGTLSNIPSSVASLTTFKNGTFMDCTNLTTVNFSKLTPIPAYAFMSCTGLTTVSFAAAKPVQTYAFNGCTNLTSVSLPLATTISGYAFANCTKLTSINLPKATTIYGSAFYNCQQLKTVVLSSSLTKLSSSCFRACYHLISLYLYGSTIPTLISTAFTSTPIGGYSTSAGQYGKIYVKSSLFASFKTAANWSLFSARMVSM